MLVEIAPAGNGAAPKASVWLVKVAVVKSTFAVPDALPSTEVLEACVASSTVVIWLSTLSLATTWACEKTGVRSTAPKLFDVAPDNSSEHTKLVPKMIVCLLLDTRTPYQPWLKAAVRSVKTSS
jgi:hypothetical protein